MHHQEFQTCAGDTPAVGAGGVRQHTLVAASCKSVFGAEHSIQSSLQWCGAGKAGGGTHGKEGWDSRVMMTLTRLLVKHQQDLSCRHTYICCLKMQPVLQANRNCLEMPPLGEARQQTWQERVVESASQTSENTAHRVPDTFTRAYRLERMMGCP